MLKKPTSFSQNHVFEVCPREWYYQYVLKVPVVSGDTSYADAGTVVHKTLEIYYNTQDIELPDLKEEFNSLWEKYKLDESLLRLKRDKYWLMVLEGINKNFVITSTELKIFYTDAIAYLDAVNTEKDEIVDWKTGTRSDESEDIYKKQLMFYCYLYYRKFNRLPKKATAYYLKYTGTKGEVTVIPTMQDVIDIEKWHFDIRQKMSAVIYNRQVPPMCKDCNFFCPYKNLCFQKEGCLNFTLHVIGNNIKVEGPMTQLLHKGIDKKFSYELKNAYFMKKANPMARTTVKFWNLNTRSLPIGFKQGLVKTLKDYAEYKKLELALRLEDHREFDETSIKMPNEFINNVVLRDYQTDAVDTFLRNKIGVLEIGTGGGKTEIAIECIRRLGVKSLFIVDKIELLRQTRKRIKDSLGIEVGSIGAGTDDIKPITVATVQTLNKRLGKYASYLRSVRFVIFDETHKVAAKSYYKISRQLINSEYRLGISGTAYRDDGNDMMITASTGYKVFDLSSKRLIEKGWLVLPKITFIKNYMDKELIERKENEAKTGLINETPNYNNYYGKFISENVDRNLQVVELVEKNKNKKILILTKLIDHGKLLKEMLEKLVMVEHLYGETAKKERERMFDEFVKGNVNVLVSTISIFSEGIDIPSLDIVINVGANKGDVKTIQMLGRVLRKMEGKKGAHYYDFIDETKFFRMASLARKRALKREGHDIDEEDSSKPNQ